MLERKEFPFSRIFSNVLFIFWVKQDLFRSGRSSPAWFDFARCCCWPLLIRFSVEFEDDLYDYLQVGWQPACDIQWQHCWERAKKCFVNICQYLLASRYGPTNDRRKHKDYDTSQVFKSWEGVRLTTSVTNSSADIFKRSFSWLVVSCSMCCVLCSSGQDKPINIVIPFYPHRHNKPASHSNYHHMTYMGYAHKSFILGSRSWYQ